MQELGMLTMRNHDKIKVIFAEGLEFTKQIKSCR